MPRSRKAVEAALRGKGFERIEGDHHYFVYVTKSGRITRARTKTSHSPKVKEIADNLLGQMARQCLLSRPDFLKLVDCPMDRDEYERSLVERGEIDESEVEAGGESTS
ncbi:MAG: hypothetical protein U0800_17680 [Isosphaeraceae bacterium]